MRSRSPYLLPPESGQAMVEFIIIFPVLFLLILLILQTGLLLSARHLVHYAAFCAARSAIVSMHQPAADEEYPARSLRAAAVATIPVSPAVGLSLPMASDTIQDLSAMAGEEAVPKFLMSRYILTDIEIMDSSGNSLVRDLSGDLLETPLTVAPLEEIIVQVSYKYVLSIPLINKLFSSAYWAAVSGSDSAELVLPALDPEDEVQQWFINNLQETALPEYWIPLRATSVMTVQGEIKNE